MRSTGYRCWLTLVIVIMIGTAMGVKPLVVRLTAQQPAADAVTIDLTGEWANRIHEDAPERGAGPELGDYLGLPINDAARLHGDTWDASLLTMPEHQCMPHPSTYALRGPYNFRIWKEVKPDTQEVVAIRTHGSWMAPERTIYMDGRPHPPEYAPHTWQGFTTGKWEGNMLTAVTTHVKEGWIRRNGIHHSDQVTMVEHYLRHGNWLTVVTILTDPVYLTEPFIRTSNWEWDPNQNVGAYPCNPFHIVVEIERPMGAVPHHLPGTNQFLKEFGEHHGIPFEATRGGAETTYPEYLIKLKELLAKMPKKDR